MSTWSNLLGETIWVALGILDVTWLWESSANSRAFRGLQVRASDKYDLLPNGLLGATTKGCGSVVQMLAANSRRLEQHFENVVAKRCGVRAGAGVRQVRLAA